MTEGVPVRAAANGHVPQASKPVTPQKPVSYAQLLNGHTTAPASAHADTDTTTEEESIADVQTTSEKSTPPKGDRALPSLHLYMDRVPLLAYILQCLCRAIVCHASSGQGCVIMESPPESHICHFMVTRPASSLETWQI